mmetsp:Transcript_14410/g.28816  ORF Transcript_14410/g.28816 Transcript_14410/m.28816 type:complete len:206 (-) Transcript_14410:5-622(-)
MVRTPILFLLGLSLTPCAALSAVRNCAKKLYSPRDASRREAVATLLAAGLPALAASGLSTPAAAETVFLDGPRGLKYTVLKEGSGPTPVRAQKVKTDYVLTLNGFRGESAAVKEIDSSSGFLRGPFGFRVGVSEVITGWDLAVMDMKAGEKRRLIIPSELGYGAAGMGGAIPAFATLYFEVELLELKDIPDMGEQQQQWLKDHPL